MANEFIIKHGFRSKGPSEITGSLAIPGFTDVSASLAAAASIPTLQQVVDQGSSTTTAITASAISSSTLISAGDLTLDADGADILLKDGGTEFGRFKRDNSDFIIKSATQDKDIVFRGNDGGGTVNALTLDMSEGGKGIFTAGLIVSGSTIFKPLTSSPASIEFSTEAYSGRQNPTITLKNASDLKTVHIGQSQNDGLFELYNSTETRVVSIQEHFQAFSPPSGISSGYGTYFGVTSSISPTAASPDSYVKIAHDGYSGVPYSILQVNKKGTFAGYNGHQNNSSGSITLQGIMNDNNSSAPTVAITDGNGNKVVNFGGPGFVNAVNVHNNYLKYGLQIGGDFTGNFSNMALTDGSLIISGSTGGFSVKSVSSEAEIKTNDGDTTLTLGTTSSFSYLSASAFKGDNLKLTNVLEDATESTKGLFLDTNNDVTFKTVGTNAFSSTTIPSTTNGVNNRIATFTGASAFNGEANLTFDGSTFKVVGDTLMTGSLNVSGSTTIELPTGTAFEVLEGDKDQKSRFIFDYSNGDPTFTVASRASTAKIHIRQDTSNNGLYLDEDGNIYVNNTTSDGVKINGTCFAPIGTNANALDLGSNTRPFKDLYLQLGGDIIYTTSNENMRLQHINPNELRISGSDGVAPSFNVLEGSITASNMLINNGGEIGNYSNNWNIIGDRPEIRVADNLKIQTQAGASQIAIFAANHTTTISGSLTVGGASSLSSVDGRIDAKNDVVAFSTSDERLKDNITPIENALDKVSQVQGIEFDWIPKEGVHGNEGHDVGVIAQEIEKVLPEVVATRDNGYKAVKYEKIIPLLVEAIKELQAEVQELKNSK